MGAREGERTTERERFRESERRRKYERNYNGFTARRFKDHFSTKTTREKRGYTLFVDYITKLINKEGLEDIFRFESGKGFLGVYLSFKPQKSSSSLFGFARFGDKEDVMRAKEKVDGPTIGGADLKWTSLSSRRTVMTENNPGTRRQIINYSRI